MIDLSVVFICLVLNSIFSAYEMAFVTISKEDINDMVNDKKKVGTKVLRFKKRTERTLSVIQIGITLVGALAAAVGGNGVASELEPYLVDQYGLSTKVANMISVGVVIIPLTYVTVVFGELIPKTIALRHPKAVLGFATNLLYLIDRVLSPIVSFLEISTGFILRRLGLASSDDEDMEMESVDISELPVYHQKFVQNLVGLKSRRVSKVFVPKEKTFYFNFSDSDEVVQEKIVESMHSRFPVIDGDVIVGVLHKKEFDEAKKLPNYPWQGILSPAIHIKETDRVLEAFLQMQEENQHLAVVVDKEGEFKGIITLEDILEEIVGDIKDDMDRSRFTRLLSRRSRIQMK